MNNATASPLRIIATTDVPQDELEAFHGQISEFIPSEIEGRLALFSAEHPQYLDLIGRVLAWAPLTAPATAFLVKLAQKAAEWTWENRGEIFKASKNWADARLKGVAAAILLIKRKHPRIKVGLGVEFDQPNYPAFLWLDSDDEAEIIWILAVFLVNAKQVKAMLQEEISKGHRPLGWPIISVMPPGSLTVTWVDKNFKQHEIIIPYKANRLSNLKGVAARRNPKGRGKKGRGRSQQ